MLALAGVAYWMLALSSAPQPSTEAFEETNLISALAELPDEGFLRPSSTWQLTLPEDHQAHPEARTETWQVSTHLRNSSGEVLGFQFSFLRVGIAPPTAPPPESNWDVGEILRGHVTLLDAETSQAIGEERFARGLPELAGYDPVDNELRLDSWFLRFEEDSNKDTMVLSATASDKAIVKLVMRPEKPATALEPNGADAPFVGYFFSRLAAEGTVDHGNGEELVSGTAWLDHSWGDLPVPGAGPVAWDRLQFQLEDGTDVSLVRSRRTDGRGSATTNGILVNPNGMTSVLDEDSVQMTTTRIWRHETTGTEYPVAWRLEGPLFDLKVEPLIDAQVYDFAAPFWSGIVALDGRLGEAPVSGFGTLQLTGYAQ